MRCLKYFGGAVVLCALAFSTQPRLTRNVTAAPLASNTVAMVPLYRLLDRQTDQHFYTTNKIEKETLLKYQTLFQDEGIAGYVFPERVPGTIPLFRLVLNRHSKHFYTTKANERYDAVQKYNYKDEGVACYVSEKQQSGTLPLYRLYRPEAPPRADDHFYTADETERYKAQFTFGYQPEGNEGYIWAKPSTDPSSGGKSPNVTKPVTDVRRPN